MDAVVNLKYLRDVTHSIELQTLIDVTATYVIVPFIAVKCFAVFYDFT
jgi:hypothetical protein